MWPSTLLGLYPKPATQYAAADDLTRYLVGGPREAFQSCRTFSAHTLRPIVRTDTTTTAAFKCQSAGGQGLRKVGQERLARVRAGGLQRRANYLQARLRHGQSE